MNKQRSVFISPSVFSLLLIIVLLFGQTGAAALANPPASDKSSTPAQALAPIASGWTLVKFPQGQPLCTGLGFLGSIYYDRLDCGFGYVSVSETTATSTVKVSLIDSAGVTQNTQTTTFRTAEVAWEFDILPTSAWAAGPVTIRVTEVNGISGNFGETTFFLNQLGATVAPDPGNYSPGDSIPVSGTTFEIDQIPPLAAAQQTNVGATFSLQVVWPDGTVMGPYGPFSASDVPGPARGTFTATIPGSATTGLTANASTNFQATVSIEVINASYTDTVTGAWAAERAGNGAVTLNVPPDALILENSFVSSVGWVKPGDTYPFRIFVKNFASTPESNAIVTIPVPDGTTFTQATATAGSGNCSISGGTINWNIGTVPAATEAGPAIKTCVAEAIADTLGQDPQIVWKNLSSTATLTYAGGSTQISTSHGPKVIPPSATYDTARYGDRPFPVVPVDYFDRKHASNHTGDALSNKINSPDIPGSTFNLYQEMSYQQLFPNGTVPSAGITSADWDYVHDFEFTTPAPQGTCYGTSFKDVRNTPLYPERIVGGWYQLPGDTAYYGADQFGSAVPGAVVGVGPLLQIDNACGPTGKAVFDAAQIADPEIDYSDYDTDKDGVVDFFMMVFVGAGGNGASQTSVPPYDNIWPHSSSLEFYFSNQGPYGQQGYVSDDQLKNLKGQPLYYTDSSASTMTTAVTTFPVYVRVGPYNVNPETAIDNASVISHEYGHSLGLPDFYSLGDRETYGDWNLMATDKSQNMDVFSKQELGWLIPRVLQPGETTASNWQDSKLNTNQIDWQQPDGTPYTLTGPGVNNGEGYVAKLPARKILDPAKFDSAGPGEGATPSHVWWSQSGNDFGCTPTGAHNLDIFLPELATLPPGTTVSVTFKSYWDIEWDYDYGFVMISTDGGTTYTSLPSANGFTTAATFNPYANACQAQYGNGITGSSGSFEAGTQNVDRLLGQYTDGGFLTDTYDLSSAVGSATVLRFSYATDPGLARPGWFIDDLSITADGNVIYETDFETSGDSSDPRVYPGGCKGTGLVAVICTAAWQYIDAAEGASADHAYYMEMRDRSGFDLDGKDENDRDPIAFLPGLLLTYTDEAHGYGNVGTDNPPAQTPIDSQPQPDNDTPNLHDAAFTAAAGDNRFSDSGEGHTDNYSDPSNSDVDPRYPAVANPWRFRFDCLTFDVLSMAGTDNGPGTVPPYNLTGDVQFTIGDGCAPFDYGNGVPNGPPTANAQARPTTTNAGSPVTFDGSASFDDRQPANELTYEWDFDYDGAIFNVDSTGQVVQHSYAAPGTYTATLRVTDEENLSDTDSVIITVLEPPTRPTSTSVNCTPGSVQAGIATTCTATVSDTGSGTPSTPTGTVSWSSNGSGSFGSASCTLNGSGGSASCSVSYTPGAVGSGTHAISASYSGNATHTGSSGSFNLTVTTQQQGTRRTSTSVSCTPDKFQAGSSTTCKVTVRDTGSGTKSAPTGVVSWSSSAEGTFTPVSCTLAATNKSSSSCSVSYTSDKGGTHSITATYGGDASHAGSSGNTNVTVNSCFDDEDGQDDDDFDNDCVRDDQDVDDDNDGIRDEQDDDDDNDGIRDDQDDDDDNDGIPDEFDNKSTRERSKSSSAEVAGGGQIEYVMVAETGTVLLTAVAVDGLALTVDIYDPQGMLIGSSLPLAGRAIVTAVPTSPGNYVVKVQNSSGATITSLVTLIQSDIWP